jgi:hypothetical protein
MRPNKQCRVTTEELLDLQEGRLDAHAAGRLRSHLAGGCQICEGLLAQTSRLLSVMGQGELNSAPDHVVARAQDLFRERFVKPARRSLFAQLVFDSRSQLALSGARGAEGGQIRILYSTGEHDVDLWQERRPDGRWSMIGQVMPLPGGEPIFAETAVLEPADGPPMRAKREGAELHLEAVPAGKYSLRIVLPDAEIVMDDVVVGA